MNLRDFLNAEFEKLKSEDKNVISISASVPDLFERVTSPNEFAGPIVEAWAHLNLEKIFKDYQSAKPGGQEFADAQAFFEGQKFYLNIKAKERRMGRRSRINLSSYNRYVEHYTQSQPASFYILVCQYRWETSGNELKIIIEDFKHTFDLLEIPLENYKIEGAFEGSYRVFISPIPEVARSTSEMSYKRSPKQFVDRLNELRETYDTRKRTKGSRGGRS